MNAYVDGRLLLEDDDVIQVNGRRYRFGTVSGCCVKWRESEKTTERIDRAIERGHKLVWLNAEAVMLVGAGQPQPDRSFIATLEIGDVIYCDSNYREERGFYELTREPNQNVGLVRVEG